MKKFFAHLSGRIVGPLTVDEIKKSEGFNRGTMVYPEDLIETGTSKDWKPAFQIAEFGSIPFTQVKPPLVVPNRSQSIHKNVFDDPKSVLHSVDGWDAEKKKLEDKIKTLEKEQEKSKNRVQENENLKTQINEKDQKIYELLKEIKNRKELIPEQPKTSNPSVEQNDFEKKSVDYIQFEIPFKRIMDIVIAVLLIATVSFVVISGLAPNSFIRRLFSKSSASMPDADVSLVTVSSQTVQYVKKNARTKKEEPEKDWGMVKRQTEKKILEKYKQKKNAQEKANSYLEQKISFNESDPNYESFLKAKDESDAREKEYKDLTSEYKKNYGEEAWNDFVEKVKKSSGPQK